MRRVAVFVCSCVLWIAGTAFTVAAEDDQDFLNDMLDSASEDMANRVNRVAKEVEVIVHGGLFNLFCDNYQMTPDEFLQQHLNGNSWDSEMIVEAIHAGGNVDMIDDVGTPLVVRAVMGADINVLAALIEHNVDLNARRAVNQYTALHQAVRMDVNGRFNANVEVVRMLLEAGAYVDPRSDMGNTPLALLMINFPRTAEVEVEGDAGVERQERARQIAELLIQYRAEVNVRNYDNNTPLHQVAEYNGNPVAAQVLVDHRAELLAVNNLGLTPHRVVEVRGGGQDIRSLLRIGIIAYAQFLFQWYRQMPRNVYNAACFNAPM